jgi:putative PIN family toxin of toxin-antitoxin system
LAAIEGKVLPVTSMVLLRELEEVLKRRKFNYPPEAISAILYEVQTLAVMAHPNRTLHVVKNDPADNRVLECALAARADWIVTGDKGLLGLRKFRGIKILSPNEFLSNL